MLKSNNASYCTECICFICKNQPKCLNCYCRFYKEKFPHLFCKGVLAQCNHFLTKKGDNHGS